MMELDVDLGRIFRTTKSFQCPMTDQYQSGHIKKFMHGHGHHELLIFLLRKSGKFDILVKIGLRIKRVYCNYADLSKTLSASLMAKMMEKGGEDGGASNPV